MDPNSNPDHGEGAFNGNVSTSFNPTNHPISGIHQPDMPMPPTHGPLIPHMPIGYGHFDEGSHIPVDIPPPHTDPGAGFHEQEGSGPIDATHGFRRPDAGGGHGNRGRPIHGGAMTPMSTYAGD